VGSTAACYQYNHFQFQKNHTITSSFGAKKQKTGRFDRRKIVDIETSSDVTMATKHEELPGNKVNGNVVSCQGYIRKERIKLDKEDNKRKSDHHASGSRSVERSQHQHHRHSDSSDHTRKKNFEINHKTGSLLNLKNDDKVINSRDFGKMMFGLRSEESSRSYLARKKQKQDNLDEANKEILDSNNLLENIEEIPQQTWKYYKNLKGSFIALGKNKTTSSVKSDAASKKPDSSKTLSSSIVKDEQTKLNFTTESSVQRKETAEKMLQAFG